VFRSPVVAIPSLLGLSRIVKHLLLFGACSLLLGLKIKGILRVLLMDPLLIAQSLNSLIVLNIHLLLRNFAIAFLIRILLEFGGR